jgi:hypothetical protein
LALAEAIREEYKAIVDAGFILSGAAGRYFVCPCCCRRSIARAICSCSSAIFVKLCSRKRFALARCHFADFSSMRSAVFPR